MEFIAILGNSGWFLSFYPCYIFVIEPKKKKKTQKPPFICSVVLFIRIYSQSLANSKQKKKSASRCNLHTIYSKH